MTMYTYAFAVFQSILPIALHGNGPVTINKTDNSIVYIQLQSFLRVF